MITLQSSGNWLSNVLEPDWEVKTDIAGVALLRSRHFSDPARGIFYCRECVLDVPGKFFAETSLVYPQSRGVFPIFGSEYIQMARGSFGAVDFHPTQTDNNTIPDDFGSYPNRTVSKSPHYDLDQHFSPVLWHKKSPDDFYDEFADVAEERLTHYLRVLPPPTAPDSASFAPFDAYMALNDPARGILKAYFGVEFSDDYIRRFLFPHC